VTNEASLTIMANRFVSNVPGCPSVVDSYGTLMAMTGGQNLGARPPVVRSVAEVWQTWFAHADYIWLGSTGGENQIPWTHALYSYFAGHFRLVAMASRYPAHGNVPRGGLYVRRLAGYARDR